MMVSSTQISMYDYLNQCRDEVVDVWGKWRDAQELDDVAKQLVDEVYGEYICTLDKLIDTVLPF